MPNEPTTDLPEAALAFTLAEQAASRPVMFVARSELRMDRLARFCAGFCAGRAELLCFPSWDVLPYDRTAPSAAVVGRRVHTLARLAQGAEPGRGMLLLASVDAVVQRVPPRDSWAGTELRLRLGDPVEIGAFRQALGERGYHLGETVVEPGEVAFHGHVIDLFPAGVDDPVRLEIADGRIGGLHVFDAVTQRSTGVLEELLLPPAVEFPLDPAQAVHVLEGDDAPLVLPSGTLVPVFDYLRGVTLLKDEGVDDRWSALREAVDDAYAANRLFVRRGAGVLPPPERLFLSADELHAALKDAEPVMPAGEPTPAPLRVAELIAQAKGANGAVVIAGGPDSGKLAASLSKRGLPTRLAKSWPEAVSGGVACLDLELDGGFRACGLRVIPAVQLMRHGHHDALHGAHDLLDGDTAPRVGDVVVHADHGAARLIGLQDVVADGFPEERLILEFAGDKELLCHPSELDRIWRYGAEGSVDRLDGPAWQTRKREIEAEIADTAAHLAARAAERARRTAPAMEPDRAAFDRLSLRFHYALSPDQQAAVEDVLADLRRGSPPTDRLVCGDVGFGKTEVALRAAAAVALSGFQVAVVAPTTVLARQHLDTFRRRFEGTGIRVEGLMAASAPRAREVRAGLADGSIGIVVGTQGLAAKGVEFARLGLVVIDEEQRLGEGLKGALAGTHRLVMTATPIPRTLQAATVGLQEVSVIATPPLRRQPTRTLVMEFDPATVREALVREHARGGQSFVVCPRISDLSGMAAMLADTVPELRVVTAHGRMLAEELEAAVVGFAGGSGDVLLATDIIESGLDIPRANTIVVTDADRFGLAQLHQMRGRVGRGGRRGTAFLTTSKGRRLAAATRNRLHALAAQSHLGAGIAISAADLDQRGAGDMFGEQQAGHVSALGTELYQDLLVQALEQQRGGAGRRPPPELHVGLTGRIPAAMVPEPDLRIALYRRLARLGTPGAVDDFADELHDRFGDVPAELSHLLALVRLRAHCAEAGVQRLDAGPRGASFQPWGVIALPALQDRLGGTLKADRVIVALPGATAAARVAALTEMLS